MSEVFDNDVYMLESFAMYVVFFMPTDSITPNLDLSSNPGFPLVMNVNEKPFLNLDMDSNTGNITGLLVDNDDLTTDDNLIYTRDQLIQEFSDPKYDEMGEYIIQYLGMFDNVRVIISHKPATVEPADDDEEVTPEKKEEKKEEKKNPATGDKIIAYISLLSLSTIGLSIVKIRKKKLEY